MDCSEFNRFLDKYEMLDSSEKSILNNHAAECEKCRSELEFYQSIINTSASLPIPDPPADLIAKTNKRIDMLSKNTISFDKAVNSFRNNSHRYMTAAACLAVGVIVGINGKNIGNKLLNNQDDGIINTSVSISDSSASNEYKRLLETTDNQVTDESSTETVLPEAAESVFQTTAPTDGLDASSIAPQISPVANSLPVATAVPTQPAKKASESTPKQTASVSAAISVSPEPTMTDVPTSVVSNTSEPEENHRYKIDRDGYHIPEATAAPETTTKSPASSIELTDEQLQIAMSSYEFSEAEKKELARNKLIVSEADKTAIVNCMNKAHIRGTTDGYVASIASFYNFLSMLDAQGLYYYYIECSETTTEVSFVLLAN